MTALAMYAAYMLSGALAGLLSGLFGIAGGLVRVPTLLVCFAWTGVPADVIAPLALGTSLSAILFTNALANWHNHRQQVLREPFSRSSCYLALALGAGVTAGSPVSITLPRLPLLAFLATFQVFMSAWLLRGTFTQFDKVAPTSSMTAQDRLPPWRSRGVMVATGFLSAMGGIGGSSLLVTLLRSQDIEHREAAALGTFLSCTAGVAGFLGYGLLAHPVVHLGMTIGYVNGRHWRAWLPGAHSWSAGAPNCLVASTPSC